MFGAGLKNGHVVADLGAGSGFYALGAAKVVGNSGKVFVVDVQESTLEHVASEARMRMIRNIQTIRADLEQKNSVEKIPSGSCDFVIFSNVFHQVKNRDQVLIETYRILKTGGKILVVDWNDKPSPIGPASNERLSEDEAKKQVTKAGFKFVSEIDADNFHYSLVFSK